MHLRAVKELVGFLRRRLPCTHLRSAHASLHALLIHARAAATPEALDAGAIPHLLFALSSSDQKTRKRAARMLSLLLEASAAEATAILARLECAAPLLRLLRHGDFPERAEAVDLIYLLRGSTQVRWVNSDSPYHAPCAGKHASSSFVTQSTVYYRLCDGSL
jgi:hypothetical protein